jgi:hypothetical protein
MDQARPMADSKKSESHKVIHPIPNRKLTRFLIRTFPNQRFNLFPNDQLTFSSIGD